jgi:hypothetical protein
MPGREAAAWSPVSADQDQAALLAPATRAANEPRDTAPAMLFDTDRRSRDLGICDCGTQLNNVGSCGVHLLRNGHAMVRRPGVLHLAVVFLASIGGIFEVAQEREPAAPAK